jgi:hypothetical protein
LLIKYVCSREEYSEPKLGLINKKKSRDPKLPKLVKRVKEIAITII